MKLAIVILNWNGAHMMRKYLPVVLKNSPEATVIVADNASTDDSLEMLAKEFPEVKTIVLDKNYGFAGGYNKALAQVEAEYYLLLNSDVDVPEGWLAPLLHFMDNHPEAAACQPKLHAITNREEFEYAGAAGGYIDKYGYPFCRGRIFNTIEKDHGQYDDDAEILWATGACMMVRAKDYWDAGALDDRFFAHNEEIDLCWRIRLLGRKIYCVTDSVAYHLGGGTLPKGNPRKTYLNFRNNLLMLYKNLPAKDLHSVLLCRMILDYVAAMQALILKHNWKDFKAILRARRDYRRMKKEYKNVRKQIQLSRTGAIPPIPDRMSYTILLASFIKRP